MKMQILGQLIMMEVQVVIQLLTGNSFGAPMYRSVAILAEAFPSLTPKEIAARLLATADNTWFTSDATADSNGVKHGFNFRFGHSIPDLYAVYNQLLQICWATQFWLEII